MSNRTDWENVATEIELAGRKRLLAELHNAFVAGQESIAETRLVSAAAEILDNMKPGPPFSDAWLVPDLQIERLRKALGG